MTLRKLETPGLYAPPTNSSTNAALDPNPTPRAMGAPAPSALGGSNFSGNASGMGGILKAPRYENLKHIPAPKRVSAGGILGTGILAGIVGPKVTQRRVSNRIVVPNYNTTVGGIGGTGHATMGGSMFHVSPLRRGDEAIELRKSEGGVFDTVLRVGVPDLVEGVARSELRNATSDKNTTKPPKIKPIRGPGLPRPPGTVSTSMLGKVARPLEIESMTVSTAAQTASPGDVLEQLVKSAPSAEQVTLLQRVGHYSETLHKNWPELAAMNEDDLARQLSGWFDEGDALMKRAVWDAITPDDYRLVPLPEDVDYAAGLQKMVGEAANDMDRNHLLLKAEHYKGEIEPHLDAMLTLNDAELGAVLGKWFDAGDGEMKKAIAASILGRAGKSVNAAIMGGRKALGDTAAAVKEVVGNAASHVGSKIGAKGVKANPGDTAGLPSHSTGEGAGKHMEGAPKIPARKMGARTQIEDPNGGRLASDPTNSGKVVDARAMFISRKGATGGLGNHTGAGGPGGIADPKAMFNSREVKGQTIFTSGKGGGGKGGGGNTTSGGGNLTGKQVQGGLAAAASLGGYAGYGVGAAAGRIGARRQGVLSERQRQQRRAAAKSEAAKRMHKMPNYMKKSADDDTSLGEELIKIAPDEMVHYLHQLPEDDRLEAVQEAEHHAASLMTFSDSPDLAKRDMAADVHAWMMDEGDVDLKKWTAEALAGTEEIPVALADLILAWQPPARAQA